MMDGFFPGFFLGVFATVIIFVTTAPDDTQNLKAEAVKRHAAEWVVDPATGSTTFKWKEVTQP